jgi:peptide deformylase
MDLSRDQEEKKPLYFVNPEIITNSNNQASYEEGCLSVPGQFAEINRPDKCRVKYLDYSGDEKVLEAEGLLATCIQHEIDHLEGILFIDYLSKLKRSMIVKKLSKQKKSLERIVV